MKKDKEAIYGLLAPWIFIMGVCCLMIILLIIDFAFGLSLVK